MKVASIRRDLTGWENAQNRNIVPEDNRQNLKTEFNSTEDILPKSKQDPLS